MYSRTGRRQPALATDDVLAGMRPARSGPLAGDSRQAAKLERRGRIVAWLVLGCVVSGSTIGFVARIRSDDAPAARTSKATSVRPASAGAVTADSPLRPDAQLVAAVSRDLAPIGVSRQGLHGLRAGSLLARAASARNVARLERDAAFGLAGLATPARDGQAMAALRRSLASEAAAFAALGAAAAGNNRSAYARARFMVFTASKLLSAAAQVFTRQGFVLPPLPALYLVSLPSPPSAPGARASGPAQRPTVAPATQQPTAPATQQPAAPVTEQRAAPVTQRPAALPSSPPAASSSPTESTASKPLSPVVVVVPAGSTTSSRPTPPSTVVVVPCG